MTTPETRCIWCHRLGHIADEHPLHAAGTEES